MNEGIDHDPWTEDKNASSGRHHAAGLIRDGGAALTTEALTRLKASGLGEDVIRFMVESDYDNVDRVVQLKEAGFSDETVSSVIRADLKSGGEAKRPIPPPENTRQAQPAAEAAAILRTTGTVKIEQYMVRGEPVVQNSQDIPGATISLLEGGRLKIEWDPTKVPANFFRRKPFASRSIGIWTGATACTA